MTVKRRGNTTLGELKSKLRALPTAVAHRTANAAAPTMTGLTAGAYDAGQNVYGEARPRGVQGVLSLVKSGATRRDVRFVATGTIVRCVLPQKYARFLVGKYGILPNGAMPAEWARRLRELTATEVKRAL